MELKAFKCPNCMALLTPIEGKHYMFCQYCGSRIVIDDIEFYREDAITEREKIHADKEERIHEQSEQTKREHNAQKSELAETAMAIVFFFLAVLFVLFVVLLTR